MDDQIWEMYPDVMPIESGYYMCYYFNIENQVHYYKAIWFDSLLEKWIPWRLNGTPDLSMVLRFIPKSRTSYYAECLEKLGALS